MQNYEWCYGGEHKQCVTCFFNRRPRSSQNEMTNILHAFRTRTLRSTLHKCHTKVQKCILYLEKIPLVLNTHTTVTMSLTKENSNLQKRKRKRMT